MLAEIAEINTLKTRQLAGEDISSALLPGSGTTIRGYAPPSVKLPTPPKVRTYKATNLWEYNEWVRENEDYFKAASREFETEADRVRFARTSLAESIKEEWQGFHDDTRSKNPLWEPTWDILRQFAKDKLGTEKERRQSALQTLRSMTLGDKTPSRLLAEMRPLWYELGIKDVSSQILYYQGSFRGELSKKILYDGQPQPLTLQDAEDQATRAWKAMGLNKPRNNEPRGTKRSLDNSETSKPDNPAGRGKGGPGKNRNKNSDDSKEKPVEKPAQQDAKKDKKRAKRFKRSQDKDKDKEKKAIPPAEPTCYNCGEAGHTRPNCDKLLKKTGKD